jgi:hypothetical protein
MSTEKKKKLLRWVVIIFAFFTFYCIYCFFFVVSFYGTPGFPDEGAEWRLTFYSIGALVSFLIALLSLIAIWKLRNQK